MSIIHGHFTSKKGKQVNGETGKGDWVRQNVDVRTRSKLNHYVAVAELAVAVADPVGTGFEVGKFGGA